MSLWLQYVIFLRINWKIWKLSLEVAEKDIRDQGQTKFIQWLNIYTNRSFIYLFKHSSFHQIFWTYISSAMSPKTLILPLAISCSRRAFRKTYFYVEKGWDNFWRTKHLYPKIFDKIFQKYSYLATTFLSFDRCLPKAICLVRVLASLGRLQDARCPILSRELSIQGRKDMMSIQLKHHE